MVGLLECIGTGIHLRKTRRTEVGLAEPGLQTVSSLPAHAREKVNDVKKNVVKSVTAL